MTRIIAWWRAHQLRSLRATVASAKAAYQCGMARIASIEAEAARRASGTKEEM